MIILKILGWLMVIGVVTYLTWFGLLWLIHRRR